MKAETTSIPVKLIIETGEAQIGILEAELPIDARMGADFRSLSIDSLGLRASIAAMFREAADQIEEDELAARRISKER